MKAFIVNKNDSYIGYVHNNSNNFRFDREQKVSRMQLSCMRGNLKRSKPCRSTKTNDENNFID